MLISPSVIVAEFHVIGIAVNEPKADSPLIVDRNGVLSLTVALEWVEPIARRNLQVVNGSHKTRAQLPLRQQRLPVEDHLKL